MTDPTNLPQLKEITEQHLLYFGVSIDTQPDGQGRGDVYTIQTKEAVLRITLGKSWIGYTLSVPKGVAGQAMTALLNTEDYPLGGEYASISREIFDETILCTKALLCGRIYVGNLRRRSILALPQLNGSYLVLQKGRFRSPEAMSSEEQLKAAPHMRALQ